MSDPNLEPCLENIGKLACERVPEDFLNILIRFRKIGKLNELFLVYEPASKPGFYKNGDILNGADAPIMAALSELWLKFTEAGEEPWTSTTLEIQSDGEFSIDFGYDDFDRIDFAKWHDAWEEKHLHNLKFTR